MTGKRVRTRPCTHDIICGDEIGLEEAENHKTGFRPWGKYLSIASDEFWQVKLIKVKPGHSLSFQKNNNNSKKSTVA